MRAGAGQLDFLAVVAVNENPIALDMAAPIAVPRTLQRVIVLNRRELFSLAKGVDYRFELVKTIAAALDRPEIFLNFPEYRTAFMRCDIETPMLTRQKVRACCRGKPRHRRDRVLLRRR